MKLKKKRRKRKNTSYFNAIFFGDKYLMVQSHINDAVTINLLFYILTQLYVFKCRHNYFV